MAEYNQPALGEWKYGLFDCCDSFSDCFIAYLCPNCYAFCAAQDADEGLCCAIANLLLYPFCLCCLRSNVRHKRGIEGGCCGDICVTLLCPCCAAIQIKREYHI